MSNIYKGTLGLIGNTPLVEFVNIENALGLEATILGKMEYFNPAGSVKDRIAKAMIEDAEEKGILKEDAFEAKKQWGYFSKKDGMLHSFVICEKCYDDMIEKFVIPPEITEVHEL